MNICPDDPLWIVQEVDVNPRGVHVDKDDSDTDEADSRSRVMSVRTPCPSRFLKKSDRREQDEHR